MAKKYYQKADNIYSTMNWFYLIFDFVTGSTLVYPVAVITFKTYFTTTKMADEDWKRPFYYEWERFILEKKKEPFELNKNFQNRTFFPINNVYGYSILVIASALSIHSVGLGKIFIQEVYLRAGFQIFACAEDLQNEIKQTTWLVHRLFRN